MTTPNTGTGRASGGSQPNHDPREASLHAVAHELARSADRLADLARVHGLPLPKVAAVHELVETARRIVFLGHYDRHEIPSDGLEPHLLRLTRRVWELAEDLVAAGLRHDRGVCEGQGESFAHCHADAARIAEQLVTSLPRLRESIALDVRAAYDGDPATRGIDEIVLCYPGIDAVFAYRLAHTLYTLGAPLVPRIISELAHSRTGVDIHPGATIGRSFFIDHGTGVVIGETAEIGDDVRIYQGVTLGAKTFPRDGSGRVVRGAKRHPTIGSRVTIYADAVILGGDTVVGDDCVVSGAVFLTQSVPPGHVVRAKQPELVMRTNKHRIAPDSSESVRGA